MINQNILECPFAKVNVLFLGICLNGINEAIQISVKNALQHISVIVWCESNTSYTHDKSSKLDSSFYIIFFSWNTFLLSILFLRKVLIIFGFWLSFQIQFIKSNVNVYLKVFKIFICHWMFQFLNFSESFSSHQSVILNAFTVIFNVFDGIQCESIKWIRFQSINKCLMLIISTNCT